MYDDFKFLTKAELAGVGLAHLIGTPYLRAYMHGYFMDMRLYARLQSAVDPFAYDQWRKAEVGKRIAEARGNRITLRKRLPKVNQEFAEELLKKSAKGKAKGRAAKAALAATPATANPLGDDRFAAMFTDENFAIDKESETFALVNPQQRGQKRRASQRGNINESDDDEASGDLLSGGGGGGDGGSSASSDGFGSDLDLVSAELSSSSASGGGGGKKNRKKKQRKPKLFEASQGLRSFDRRDAKRRKLERRSFASRLAVAEAEAGRSGTAVAASESTGPRRVGNVTVKYVEATAAAETDGSDRKRDAERRRDRRGISDLGLKPVKVIDYRRRK